MHTGPMKDSDGVFGPEQDARCDCRKCSRRHVVVRVWESKDGAFEDWQYRCRDCGHVWWVDGVDS